MLTPTYDEEGSDIVHVSVFGYHLVVLNSKTVADDLLEKRSSMYSDRCALLAWRKVQTFRKL